MLRKFKQGPFWEYLFRLARVRGGKTNRLRDKRAERGLTLIELMVVIVIIGVLMAIAIPNFVGTHDRAKVSAVKANMQSFQIMLETFAIDWSGRYPEDVQALESAAQDKSTLTNYWKHFQNPFTYRSGLSLSYDNAQASGTVIAPGLVAYQPVRDPHASDPTQAVILTYALYGGGKVENQRILDVSGQPYLLSNN